ncbi:MAG TPA: DNA-processing protein DprA [bacterium]|nr:DNA-processing protein DprA [bacterium]
MQTTYLTQSRAECPKSLLRHLGDDAPERLTAIGDVELLSHKNLAIFCSAKCPGSIILKIYDLARELREQGTTVIGGFHSPIEKEVLNVLLRGEGSMILCPARGIEKMRIRREYRGPVNKGRLLLLSALPEKVRRPTAATALFRNRLVAALAESILIAYAAPGSKTEAFARELLSWHKPLYTFDDPNNENLIRPRSVRRDGTKERFISLASGSLGSICGESGAGLRPIMPNGGL